MALNNNFLPQTSLVFGVRDFAPQISELGNINTKALQNAFNFGTKVYDWDKDRKIAEELKQENPDVNKMAALEASKINGSQDPTSIWRWKKGLEAQEAQRAADLQRVKDEKDLQEAKALQNLKYKIDAQLKPMTMGLNTTDADLKMWKNTLADLEEQGLAGNVGEDYMNKIWNMQKSLDSGELPANQIARLTNDFDLLAAKFDTVKEQGGYGKDRDAYIADVDKIMEDIKTIYATNGQSVPESIRVKYEQIRNKYNKKKTSPRPGAPKNPGRK